MKFALVNPRWDFAGSIYFGCRDPHLPLEYGYAQALLEREGHEATIVDGQLDDLSRTEIVDRVLALAPDVVVITTAPSYLFWRCAPPELRVPLQTVRDLRRAFATDRRAPLLVAVGPHASSTPGTTLRKLGVDLVVIGECEEILARIADLLEPVARGVADAALDLPGVLEDVRALAYWHDGEPVVHGPPHASDMSALPALHWPRETIARHHHHHHRFDRSPDGPGAELEFSRGCPYRCTFCAKENFRNKYRKRPLPVVLEELDALIAAGMRYVYFIDEIFLPDRRLLEALVDRGIHFGVQTRIDLWDEALLDLLGKAGCVSIEAGVESITPEGRQALDKRCKLSTDELAHLLIFARRYVPFVQANLLEARTDDPAAIEAWRAYLLEHNVWANKPVPLFPYPGSPDYTKRWGLPDERAWERAHEHYLGAFQEFSDIQDERPLPLPILESATSGARAEAAAVAPGR
jgi:B12-binding domain/radical SAM domain protein of rhizo-twelve system